ncbi:MAG: adenylosuccinate synthase [Deltaproteobacteria bacterium]|nr:adenylosuccinate synthase [Deltaproteobacteria bacterium]
MSVIVLTGLQWGDEGKGKLVDLLCEFATVSVRFQGGNNAGHTVVLGDEKVILNLLPSGSLRKNVRCILAQGMVIDPSVLLAEMKRVEAGIGPFSPDRLAIARRAHVILPLHKQADALSESAKDGSSVFIGTTLRGIGPAYQDKAGRRGIRMVDLVGSPEDLRSRLDVMHRYWAPQFEKHGQALPDPSEAFELCRTWGDALAPYIADTSLVLHSEIERGSHVMLEGAQGTMLDIDHGTYPFVTSSNSCTLGAPAGAGLAPSRISGVLGVTKAYCTRVGEGPFPSEDTGEMGERMRRAGHEFGSTTGRPRRCGWLDIAALRYAVRLNGVSYIAITKLDVLTGIPEIKVCTGYALDGETVPEIPLDRIADATPVYESVPGWEEDITGIRDLHELPVPARRYIDKIEGWLGVPACLVSVGPERNETIFVKNPFRD